MAGPVRGMFGTAQIQTSGRYKIRNGSEVRTVRTSGQYKSRDGRYVGMVHDLVNSTAPVIAKIHVTSSYGVPYAFHPEVYISSATHP